MRRLALPFLILGAAACGVDERPYGYDPNEIVFGISQREGETRAGYEFLRLANKGGWVPYVFRDGDGDGTCYFERFADRLGHPHVDNGFAKFTGGKLPVTGLQILANQDDAVHPGIGWEDGDELTFEASGFAMPVVPGTQMTAPLTKLDGVSISGAAFKASEPITVTWTVPEGPPTRVMVAMITEEATGPGGELRCFTAARNGNVTIPAKWVTKLFESVQGDIKGRLEVASHRQTTLLLRGDWTLYVVATNVHRTQEFTGSR